MARVVVFLDDGGVMSDNHRRAPQWQRLVGAFFAPRLGGTPTAWAQANRVVAERLLAPAAWAARLEAAPDYASLERAYARDWLGGMTALVGVPLPPEEESLALTRQASAWITRRVRAACPGAVAVIRTLHAGGYPLHTASGESSTDLAGYLEGMGVHECFGRLYGPDLLDTCKAGPRYYTRLLADAGVAPAAALVVDDSPSALTWAAASGARPVLVGRAPCPDLAPTLRIDSLAELPTHLPALAAR